MRCGGSWRTNKLDNEGRMTTTINTHEPAGSVRGTAIEMMSIGGKERRIAHAFLLNDPKSQIKVSVDLPNTMTLAELRTAARNLIDFANAVEVA